MSLVIRILPSETRKIFKENVIGQVTCPTCKQDDVKVLNSDGPNGSKYSSYLENHEGNKEDYELCSGSGKFLKLFD